jgi:hypothetical protein
LENSSKAEREVPSQVGLSSIELVTAVWVGEPPLFPYIYSHRSSKDTAMGTSDPTQYIQDLKKDTVFPHTCSLGTETNMMIFAYFVRQLK